MRNRIQWVLALMATIGLGLASRRYPGLFPAVLQEYPGDALWTVAVYLGWGLVLSGMGPRRLFALALATSYWVELSQLYHAPWLDSIRGHTLGHLFLGSTFNAIDLVAYTIGAILIFIIHRVAIRVLHGHELVDRSRSKAA